MTQPLAGLIGDHQLYIDGTWRAASDGGVRALINPANGTEFISVDEASADDATAAVTAARTTFDDGEWSSTPVAERAALLRRIADLLVRDKADLAYIETLDTGKTLAESEIDIDDVDDPIG